MQQSSLSNLPTETQLAELFAHLENASRIANALFRQTVAATSGQVELPLVSGEHFFPPADSASATDQSEVDAAVAPAEPVEPVATAPTAAPAEPEKTEKPADPDPATGHTTAAATSNKYEVDKTQPPVEQARAILTEIASRVDRPAAKKAMADALDGAGHTVLKKIAADDLPKFIGDISAHECLQS